MTYTRNLLLNILAVFFINHVMPGITISSFENVPNIGADLIFSILLGLMLSLIYPVFILLEIKTTGLKIALCSFIIAFIGYLFISIFDIGVKVLTIPAAIFSIILVGSVSFFANFLEYKNSYDKEK